MSNYLVSANDLTTISLGEQDTVTSVLQNIAVILSTPKGTVPCYREFGIDIANISNKAGVLNGCETLNGIVRFFSQRIPEADIQAVVTLFGKGGGTGELVIATRDRLGCVKIGDGVEVTKDGVISVHATVSEDQMAATDDVSEMLAEIYDK